MAYEVVPEPGEAVQAQIQLDLSRKAQPFHFAVSNRAIYIPRIKLIAKTDPFYFQRVSLDQVREVMVRRLRPYALWLLAAVMIPAGLLSTILMMEPVLKEVPGTHQISGWPIAVFVCGFLVPFVAKGRLDLRIVFNEGAYRWKPPLVVDRGSKERIRATLRTIVDACQRVGLPVSNESIAALESHSRPRE